MNKKEIIKYFYEVVVSKNLLDQVADYISPECTVRAGEAIIPLGIEGMKEHLIDVKKPIPTIQ